MICVCIESFEKKDPIKITFQCVCISFCIASFKSNFVLQAWIAFGLWLKWDNKLLK